jgi:hypothetical protein
MKNSREPSCAPGPLVWPRLGRGILGRTLILGRLGIMVFCLSAPIAAGQDNFQASFSRLESKVEEFRKL